MNLIPRLAALAFLVCLLAASVLAQADDASVASAADRYLSMRTEMGAFSGAVLIARNGKVLLRKGYGYADIEKRTPYTPGTRHEVASVSKMFTAAAALKLSNAHKLSVEDPICRYFDPCPDSWKAVLIKHLIGHTSGIPDYESKLDLGSDKYLAFMTRADANQRIVAEAKTLPLDFPPGTQFNYSNTAYILLSYIVEKASGIPFAKYVEKELLRPVGMTRSGVINSQHLPAGLAVGYTRDDLGWEKTVAGVDLTAENNRRVPQLSLVSPEGDAFLYSTVDDLYKWSQVMDGAKPNVLSKDDIRTIVTDNGQGYGFGWFVGKGFNETRYRHNGALPGYWTDFIKFPDKGITIIMVSNIPARLSSIARDLSLMMLGKAYDMPVRGHVVALQPEQISPLEGKYKWPDGRILTISNKPDYLTAVLEKQFTAGLIPMSPTNFYFPLGDGTATFTIGTDGRAGSVNFHYGAEDHIAVRIKE